MLSGGEGGSSPGTTAPAPPGRQAGSSHQRAEAGTGRPAAQQRTHTHTHTQVDNIVTMVMHRYVHLHVQSVIETRQIKATMPEDNSF